MEEQTAIWLADDPEHWPVLRLALIHPWQEQPGEWDEDTLEWLRVPGSIATTA